MAAISCSTEIQGRTTETPKIDGRIYRARVTPLSPSLPLRIGIEKALGLFRLVVRMPSTYLRNVSMLLDSVVRIERCFVSLVDWPICLLACDLT